MTDNRKELLTITMTREEWDAAIRPGRSYSDRWKPHEELREKVLEDYDDRREAARAEFEATVPKLTDVVKRAVATETDRLVRAHRAGSLKVDHLGHPSSVLGGWAVSVTPHVTGGGSGLHFRRAGSWWFDHEEYPLADEERQWFVDLAHRVTGEEGEAWGLEGKAAWVSVKFNQGRG
jgi:hypothetical protein